MPQTSTTPPGETTTGRPLHYHWTQRRCDDYRCDGSVSDPIINFGAISGLRQVARELILHFEINPADHQGLIEEVDQAIGEQMLDTVREIFAERGIPIPAEEGLGEPRKPHRIQMHRIKGWKLPEGAVNCTRQGKRRGAFGNPFKPGTELRFPYGEPGEKVRDLDHAVDLFEQYARITAFYEDFVRIELAGRDLACTCRLDRRCHVDILLRIANEAPHGI